MGKIKVGFGNRSTEMNLRSMKDPAHGVVKSLGLGECLVTALVAHDPDTSAKETGKEGVEGPERHPESSVGKGVGELNESGVDEGVKDRRNLVRGIDDEKVPCAVQSQYKTAGN